MTRLKDKYLKEILPKLKEEFNIKHDLAVPRPTKVVINVGIGEAKNNPALLEKSIVNVTALAGQKPVTAHAKKAISTFKLSAGDPVGVMVTLRGERMYEFLDKLVGIVLPKVRDFRGVSDRSFDSQGNYSLGLGEQTVFPEVAYTGGAEKARGMEISIVTTASNREQGKRLLELLGMPFKKV